MFGFFTVVVDYFAPLLYAKSLRIGNEDTDTLPASSHPPSRPMPIRLYPSTGPKAALASVWTFP
jgi:hypothetical protein